MKPSTRLTVAMLVAFPFAWALDKWARLTNKRWREISKGNPR